MFAAIQSAQSLQPAPLAVRAQLAALLHAAALAPLDGIGWLRVTGSDRLRWLNGMLTNSIAQLATGAGCYNFALNAQGQIQGDLTAFLLEDSLLLETARNQIPTLLAHLNRFIIMDDVELADITAQRRGLLLAGPHAAALLTRLDLPSAPHDSLRLQSAVWKAAPLDILHAYSPLIPRFELWSDPTTIQQLTADLIAAGATPVSSAAFEDLRILEGTPRFGTDIRDKDLPQETAPIGVPSRALHFTKGCYLGQEIVERIHSRGSVHRVFSGFVLTGALPTPGSVLTAESESESKLVAALTSVASIHLPESGSESESTAESKSAASRATPAPLQLALGIIRREALENAQARNLTLTYPGGAATPIALPFAVP
jgi:aminomethyltransferase